MIKTLSFYLNRAHDPIEKPHCWVGNRLMRQKLEASVSAPRASRSPMWGRTLAYSMRGLLSSATTVFRRAGWGMFVFCFSLLRDKEIK